MFGTSTISNSLEGCQIQATPISLALDPSWSQDPCGIRACAQAGRAREPLGSLQPDRYGRLGSARYGGVAQPRRRPVAAARCEGRLQLFAPPKAHARILSREFLPFNSTSLKAC
jgi:hypothetical protein